ncbi:hypothetical protein QUF72_11170 [Desulfobacterales bacterium HSG2]|nr:hypothetical protein [Desulfobacterales bacterium HSG2]
MKTKPAEHEVLRRRPAFRMRETDNLSTQLMTVRGARDFFQAETAANNAEDPGNGSEADTGNAERQEGNMHESQFVAHSRIPSRGCQLTAFPTGLPCLGPVFVTVFSETGVFSAKVAGLIPAVRCLFFPVVPAFTIFGNPAHNLSLLSELLKL